MGFKPSTLTGLLPPGITLNTIVKVDTTSAQLNLNQQLFNLPAFEVYRAARATADVAKWNALLDRGTVVINIASQYLRVLSDTATIHNAQSQLASDRELERQAQAKKDAGVGTNLDLIRARVERQNRDQELIADTSQFEKDKIQLNRLMGLAADQPLQLTDAVPFHELESLPLDTAKQVAYKRRKDLLSLEAQLKSAQLQRRAIHYERLPAVKVGGYYGVLGQTRGLYDLLHAQDPISALALSDLEATGRIRGFVRTVHHLDAFENPVLAQWQDMAVQRARGLFCVSRMWREIVAARYGRRSVVVGNGVRTRQYTPWPDHRDAAMRGRLLPGGEPFVLAIGGVEARKNTLGLLRAFLRIARAQNHPELRLVIAGGASLLDHGAYRREFNAVLDRSGYADRVILAGVIEDADMPALYRSAALLCFPSLQEGYGLCVLEALACGIPVVAPHGAPFDEYLDDADALRVDPRSDAAIASAILRALQPECTGRARRHGPVRAAQFGWDEVAAAHLAGYHHHREMADA